MKAIDIVIDVLMFIILILLQVLVLNRIILFDVAIPLLYIYFIIKQPLGRNRFYVIISAFLLGFIIDIFLNTPGVNAAAATITATLRPAFIYLFYPKNELDITTPSIKDNTSAFIKYTITMVLMHQTVLFFIDAMTLFNFTQALVRIISSFALTTVLIIASDSLFFRRGRISGQ